MISFHKNTYGKFIFTAILFVYLSENTAKARPSESFAKYAGIDPEQPVNPDLYNGDLSERVIRQIQKCDNDVETMELCMRCAKVTKSEIVYPMCCANEEEVKDWCRRYIYYGAAPLMP